MKTRSETTSSSGPTQVAGRVWTLKLDLNERCDGVPNWLAESLSENLEDQVWRYVDRTDLERDLARRFDLDPAQVLATNGGDEGIAYLLNGLAPDTAVLLPHPIFSFYLEQVQLRPLRPVILAGRGDLSLDLAAIKRAVALHRGGLLVLTRPNNPTGEHLARAEVIELLTACQRVGSRMLLDEAYGEFASDDFTRDLAAFPNLIILRTFSKAFGMAGLRVGYLLGAAALLAPLKMAALPYNLSSIALHLARRALTPEAIAEVTGYCATVSRQRDQLAAELARWGLPVIPSQANFLCLQLGERRAEFVAGALAAMGILVRKFPQPELRGTIRFAVPAALDILRPALKMVLRPDLICLDVDNTLIDTSASFDAMVKAVVLELTGSEVSDDTIAALRERGGYNDDHRLAHALIKSRGCDLDLEQVAQRCRDHYFGNERRPGLNRRERLILRPETLANLARIAPIALVTGRDRRELEPSLAALGLPAGTFIVTADDVCRGKPDPEGVRLAMAHFGARSAWMIGDNPDDIRAARAAGALPIGVGRNRDPLIKLGALAVLDEINQIEALL